MPRPRHFQSRRSVKETWRVDSQFGTPAIHTVAAASHRRARRRLAAARRAVECDSVAVSATRKADRLGGRPNRREGGDLQPYLSAQTTWGSDAHFAPPAVRAGPPTHPVARQGLAAPLPGRPWHTSGSDRGGSDSPRRRLDTGSGRGGDSHLAFRPPRVAPAPTVPGGKARRAPLRGAGPHARRPHRWRHGGRPRPGSTRRTTLPVQHGSGGPFAPALRWPRRFGFAPEPLPVLDGPVHPQPGDSSIATRKRLLLGPALLPAQAEARTSEYYGGEVSPTATP